jgi:parvulin-like peptidyl-prolyl isomerase
MSQEQNGQEKKIKRYQIIIIIVAVLIILGIAAFFIIRGMQKEEPIPTLQTVETGDTAEVTDAVSETEFQIGQDDVVATVEGENITGADVMTSYEHVVNYYGEPDDQSVELYYAVAMEEAISLKLIKQTAAKLGVDQFTQEELDALYATSDSEWQYALDNYVSYNYALTDASTQEERDAAYADAANYYSTMGYSKDILRESYVDNEIFERVKNELCKDVVVTDEEVQAYYDEAVAGDKDIYEFDADAYENQMLMVQYGYADQEPWYRPDGYRYIKHILLAVDETLMANYSDLVARYEEQMNAEDASATDTADAAATAVPDVTETPEIPVTAEDIDAAKAAILASVQSTIDEINQKIKDGVSFDDLMAEYGTDTGMTGGDYPNGYEVSLASISYVPEFITAAFSVDTVGDIALPVVSDYGVHIVQYAGDVPAGPVELTDELKATIHQNLDDDKCNAIMNDWYDNSDIQYTGIIRSVQQIQDAEADTTDTAE